MFCCGYRQKQVNGVSGNLAVIEGSQAFSLFLLQVWPVLCPFHLFLVFFYNVWWGMRAMVDKLWDPQRHGQGENELQMVICCTRWSWDLDQRWESDGKGAQAAYLVFWQVWPALYRFSLSSCFSSSSKSDTLN